MTIIGQDNRTEIINFNEDPFDSVVAVDSIANGVIDFGNGVNAGEGSGILISPHHVLTAAHVIENTRAARITLAKDVPNLPPPRSVKLFPLSDANANISNGGALSQDSRYNGDVKDGYDVGLITLSEGESFSDSSKYIGLLAFVDPKDALDYTVTTAGYPALVRNADIDISKNSQYILRDENGDILVPLQDLFGSAGTAAQLLFSATGTINKVLNNGDLRFSDSIDIERGQSGSGVWTTLEGDEPRVLGVMSHQDLGLSPIGIPVLRKNFAASIDADAYGRIIEKMKNRLDVDSGNDLPENAIVGSDESDEIVGSYRRERILGNEGQDTISGGDADDRLEGGAGNDVLKGEKGNDRLEGGEDDDFLDGGEGENDVAIFSDDYTTENYDYVEITGSTFGVEDELITFEHIGGTSVDGKDSLENIEWAQFGGNSADGVSGPPRIIPLPLEDGVETTKSIGAIDTTVNPNPNDPPTPPYISLTAPVAMLDGDIDYTLNISPYEPDTEYNVVYVIDTSSSIDPVELQTIKDAYTDLTNFYLAQDNAENINFGVVSYDSSGRFYPDAGGDRNLTADEALVALQNLTIDTGIGTRYYDGLNQADQFLLNSRYNPFFTTSIGYFFTDGQNSGDRLDMLLKARDVRELANFQAIGYYSDLDTLTSNSLKIRDVNWIDSNQGVFIDNLGDLAPELLKSDLADDVVEVNILLDGEIVDTLTPEMLTDTPLGLTYEGELDELDVSIDAENVITAEVVFTPEANLETTTVEHIVEAGEGEVIGADGNPIDESGSGNEDQDPFEKIRNGGDSDDNITLGYVDRGANGGEGGDYIIGNNRDNILDGGAGDDTILGHGGDDTITPGEGRDKVDGGEGIDTVLYSDVIYQDNANIFLRRAGNTVSYNNTDSLTNIEYLQFADVRLNAETFEVAPIVEVEDITIVEGNSATSLAQFTFNLDAPTTTEITFNYSTEDISATADSDYNAIAGQVIMTAGETTATVEVEVVGDRTEEDHESFNNIVLITRRLQLFTV